MWKTRQGKECLVHEFWSEGRILGVVVQTDDGYTPKLHGKILPGRWPGQLGAAQKALRKETDSMRSKNAVAAAAAAAETNTALELAEVRKENAEIKHQLAQLLARMPAAPAPAPAPRRTRRTQVAAQAQEANTSNWYKTQHVSGRGCVRYVDDNTYAAFVDGARIALASGRNPTAARNAAKKIVTRELSDRGVRWDARVFS